MSDSHRNWKLILYYGASVLAAVFYNNWLLAGWLSPKLLAADGSISEYSVTSQPHHFIFQFLDIISGLIIFGLAVELYKKTTIYDKVQRYLLFGLMVLGISNLADSIWVLPCSETLNRACRVPVSLSFHNFQLPSHAYSSILIAACYFILPLLGLIHSTRHKIKYFLRISALALILAVVSLLGAVDEYYKQGSFSVRTSGAGQQFQMIVLGVWLVTAFIALIGTERKSNTNHLTRAPLDQRVASEGKLSRNE